MSAHEILSKYEVENRALIACFNLTFWSLDGVCGLYHFIMVSAIIRESFIKRYNFISVRYCLCHLMFLFQLNS